MTRDEINAIIDLGREEIISFILRLEQRIQELEARLNINSQNSSKPPSTDGYNKPAPKSNRQKSNKKRGGQKGHPGSTLEQTPTPDTIVEHKINNCDKCGCDLANQGAGAIEKRQVFDIPPMKLHVTEHQGESKCCPKCGHKNKTVFPTDVNRQVQYGKEVKTLTTYLLTRQFIPFKRTSELLQTLFGIEINEATLLKHVHECGGRLESTMDIIKNQVLLEPVAHSDETGIRKQKSLFWLHVFSTDKWTYLKLHKRHSQEAMEEIGMVNNYKGILVHDFLPAYFKFECGHGVCDAHICRELTYVYENMGQSWAWHFKLLLLSMNLAVEHAKKQGYSELSVKDLSKYEKRYQFLLDEAMKVNPEPIREGKRGKIKKSKALNLAERLNLYRVHVLLFAYNFTVPFTNNQAERDLRWSKLKQKISGCFVSEYTAEMFFRIQSYLSTVKKQGYEVYESIRAALDGNPVSFDTS